MPSGVPLIIKTFLTEIALIHVEKMVELLIKEIHTSDEIKSKAIQLTCWNHPNIQDNGELLLETGVVLDFIIGVTRLHFG